MADERETLAVLEAGYWEQPAWGQRADLAEINRLRARLGMPAVDAALRTTAPVAARRAPPPPPPDHSAARKYYKAYLAREKELAPHRAYCSEVERATAGRGMTRVAPLATMGTGGGCLLCDVCKKPIILEGGSFHNVPVDVAWARNTNPVVRASWVSWIKGGMVVEQQSNGTLRIYHGYDRNPDDCCSKASRFHAEEEAKFKSPLTREIQDKILTFLEDEFPQKSIDERLRVWMEIKEHLFEYDPGVGVNRPG